MSQTQALIQIIKGNARVSNNVDQTVTKVQYEEIIVSWDPVALEHQ